MENRPKHFQALATDKPLLKDVLEQLCKDINTSDEIIYWSEDDANPYTSFIKRVEKVIRGLQAGSSSTFMSILYRVDIPEKKYRKLMMSEGEDNTAVLTELILNRILQKVLTRKLYKS